MIATTVRVLIKMLNQEDSRWNCKTNTVHLFFGCVYHAGSIYTQNWQPMNSWSRTPSSFPVLTCYGRCPPRPFPALPWRAWDPNLPRLKWEVPRVGHGAFVPSKRRQGCNYLQLVMQLPLVYSCYVKTLELYRCGSACPQLYAFSSHPNYDHTAVNSCWDVHLQLTWLKCSSTLSWGDIILTHTQFGVRSNPTCRRTSKSSTLTGKARGMTTDIKSRWWLMVAPRSWCSIMVDYGCGLTMVDHINEQNQKSYDGTLKTEPIMRSRTAMMNANTGWWHPLLNTGLVLNGYVLK